MEQDVEISPSCEFCTEIHDPEDSLFGKLYMNAKIPSRIMKDCEHFVVMPTIGHFLKHYLLVISKRHIESMSKLTDEELSELEDLLNGLKEKLASYGHVVCFEHGGGSFKYSTCSVYHAHIHIIPVPTSLDLTSFLLEEENISRFHTFTECYQSLRNTPQYLMAMNADGSIYATDISKTQESYVSQFFRMKIAEYYKINEEWDWKRIKAIEPNLIQTLNDIL